MPSKLRLDGSAGSRVEANIGSLFDGALFLDVAVDVHPDDWFVLNPFVGSDTISTIKFNYYSFDSGGAPSINLDISNNGSASVSYTSDQFFPDSRHLIEAHYEADNTLGNSQTGHFFDSTPIGIPMQPIRPGIWAGVSEIWIGEISSGQNFSGDIYTVALYANAVPVAVVDFTILAPGTTSFLDDSGNTWTLMGGAEIVDQSSGGAGQDDDELYWFWDFP